MKRERFSVGLDRDTADKVLAIAEAEGRTASAVLRRLVTSELQKQREANP